MKIVYIAHPIGAISESHLKPHYQVKENLDKIAQIVREINLNEPNIVPFAPYYLDCIVMDDNNPAERQRGIDNDIALIKAGFIAEIWLYGNRISNGMLAEIKLAKQLNIKIVAKTLETEKTLQSLYDSI